MVTQQAKNNGGLSNITTPMEKSIRTVDRTMDIQTAIAAITHAFVESRAASTYLGGNSATRNFNLGNIERTHASVDEGHIAKDVSDNNESNVEFNLAHKNIQLNAGNSNNEEPITVASDQSNVPNPVDSNKEPPKWSHLSDKSKLANKDLKLGFIPPVHKEGKQIAQLQQSEIDLMTKKWASMW